MQKINQEIIDKIQLESLNWDEDACNTHISYYKENSVNLMTNVIKHGKDTPFVVQAYEEAQQLYKTAIVKKAELKRCKQEQSINEQREKLEKDKAEYEKSKEILETKSEPARLMSSHLLDLDVEKTHTLKKIEPKSSSVDDSINPSLIANILKINSKKYKTVAVKPFREADTTVHKWLEDFDSKASILDLPEEEKMRQCIIYLPTSAKRSLERLELKPRTLKELYDFIKQEFHADDNTLIRNLTALTKNNNETFQDYHSRMNNIAEQLSLTEDQKKMNLMEKATPPFKQNLDFKQYRTAHQLAQHFDLLAATDSNIALYYSHYKVQWDHPFIKKNKPINLPKRDDSNNQRENRDNRENREYREYRDNKENSTGYKSRDQSPVQERPMQNNRYPNQNQTRPQSPNTSPNRGRNIVRSPSPKGRPSQKPSSNLVEQSFMSELSTLLNKHQDKQKDVEFVDPRGNASHYVGVQQETKAPQQGRGRSNPRLILEQPSQFTNDFSFSTQDNLPNQLLSTQSLLQSHPQQQNPSVNKQYQNPIQQNQQNYGQSISNASHLLPSFSSHLDSAINQNQVISDKNLLAEIQFITQKFNQCLQLQNTKPLSVIGSIIQESVQLQQLLKIQNSQQIQQNLNKNSQQIQQQINPQSSLQKQQLQEKQQSDFAQGARQQLGWDALHTQNFIDQYNQAEQTHLAISNELSKVPKQYEKEANEIVQGYKQAQTLTQQQSALIQNSQYLVEKFQHVSSNYDFNLLTLYFNGKDYVLRDVEPITNYAKINAKSYQFKNQQYVHTFENSQKLQIITCQKVPQKFVKPETFRERNKVFDPQELRVEPVTLNDNGFPIQTEQVLIQGPPILEPQVNLNNNKQCFTNDFAFTQSNKKFTDDEINSNLTTYVSRLIQACKVSHDKLDTYVSYWVQGLKEGKYSDMDVALYKTIEYAKQQENESKMQITSQSFTQQSPQYNTRVDQEQLRNGEKVPLGKRPRSEGQSNSTLGDKPQEQNKRDQEHKKQTKTQQKRNIELDKEILAQLNRFSNKDINPSLEKALNNNNPNENIEAKIYHKILTKITQVLKLPSSDELFTIPASVSWENGTVNWEKIMRQIKIALPMEAVQERFPIGEYFKNQSEKFQKEKQDENLQNQQNNNNVIYWNNDIENNIYNTLKEMPKEKLQQNFQQSVSQTSNGGHIIIKTHTAKIYLRTLLDPGSTLSLLDFNVVRQLGLEKYLEPTSITFSTMTGIASTVRGKMYLQFKINDVFVRWHFIVLDFPHKDFDMLLGSDFFRTTKASVDFGNDSMTFKTPIGTRVVQGINVPKNDQSMHCSYAIFNTSNVDFNHQYTLQFDGSKTSKCASIAYVLYDKYGQKLLDHAQYIDSHFTANQVEYYSLLTALSDLRTQGIIENILIQGDSQLVINQLLGTYVAKDIKMQQLKHECEKVLETFGNIKLQHIERGKNTVANEKAQALTKAPNYNLFPQTQEGLTILLPQDRQYTVHSNLVSTQAELFKNFPTHKQYDLVLADPPYYYINSKTTPISLIPPYQMLRNQYLDQLPLYNILSKHGQAHIWSPGTQLISAFEFGRKQKLKYVTISMVWRKILNNKYTLEEFPNVTLPLQENYNLENFQPYIGAGRTTSHCYEFLLLFNKGKSSPFRTNKIVSQDLTTYEIEAQVTSHSTKPIQVYEKLRELYDVDNMNCLEIFARQRNQYNYYFDLYGNELPNMFLPKQPIINQINEINYVNSFQDFSIDFQNQQESQNCNDKYHLKDEITWKDKSYFLQSYDTPKSYLQTIAGINIELPIEQMVYNITSDTIKQERLKSLKIGDKDVTPPQYVYQTLQENLDAFTWDYPNDITGTNLLDLKFQLKDYDQPIQERVRQLSPQKEAHVKKEVETLLKAGVIRESKSPYASALVVVFKKNGEMRVCQDFRPINLITISDKYPLPRQDVMITFLSQSKYFITLDFKSGFWQIPIHPDHIQYTAFICQQGLFEWLGMPFGLKNAPAVFQRAMNKLFRERLNKGVMVYVDDVVIYGQTIEEINEILQWALQQVIKANLKLNPKKCHFFVSKIDFLGHVIKNGIIYPDYEKVSQIAKIPVPQTKKQMRQFLGAVNYYRKFLPDCDLLLKPLSNLTRDSITFQINEEHQKCFQIIKDTLLQNPGLKIPNDSDNLVLHSFWDSEYGMYAVLTAIDLESSIETPIEFASKSISDTQAKYPNQEGQLASIVWAIKKWKHFLYQKPFILVVSEPVTKWCLDGKDLPPKIAKWSLLVQCFDYTIQVRSKRQQRAMLTKVMRQFLQQNQVNALVSSNEDPLSKIQCEVCHSKEEIDMLLCDNCNKGYHKNCISYFIPNDEKEFWYCSQCTYILAYSNTKDPTLDVDLLFYLENGYPLTNLTNQEKQNLAEKSLLYELQDNILYYKLQDQNNQYVKREVPSIGDRYFIVSQIHRNTGHMGVKRTLQNILNTYYWPNITRDVKVILANCLPCAANKAKFYDIPKIQATQVQSAPFSLLALDSVVMNKPSSRGNKYIIVCVDAYSKWVEAIAVPNLNSATTSQFLFSEIIARYGCPYVVRTDNGTEFQGEFASLLEVYEIKHLLSSPNYSQSNGMVERVNLVIRESLCKLFNEPGFENDWDELLPLTLIGIRSCVSRSTQLSPYQVLFGRNMVIPGFLVHANHLREWTEPNADEITKYVTQLKGLHEERKELIKKCLNEMKLEIERQIQRNQNPTPHEFSFGDLVLIRYKRDNKMQTRSKGPYLFSRYTNESKNNAYVLNLKTKEFQLQSTSNLAPYGIIQ